MSALSERLPHGAKVNFLKDGNVVVRCICWTVSRRGSEIRRPKFVGPVRDAYDWADDHECEYDTEQSAKAAARRIRREGDGTFRVLPEMERDE